MDRSVGLVNNARRKDQLKERRRQRIIMQGRRDMPVRNKKAANRNREWPERARRGERTIMCWRRDVQVRNEKAANRNREPPGRRHPNGKKILSHPSIIGIQTMRTKASMIWTTLSQPHQTNNPPHANLTNTACHMVNTLHCQALAVNQIPAIRTTMCSIPSRVGISM